MEVRNRHRKKSTRGLGIQVGHDFDAVILGLERAQGPEQVISHSGIAAIANIHFEFSALFRW
ncbi:MAG: hypothetical protein DMG99_14275 [Acidobacteria bacterium]|nr:MAG: hypothetical protein DMG99_14275 [Acidobacteriota bacterium]